MNLEDVELARQKYYIKIRKFQYTVMTITAVIGIAVLLFAATRGFSPLMLFMLGFILVSGFMASAITVLIGTRKEAAEYRKAYKTYFVEKNLKQIFTDLQYNHAAGIDERILASTGMINTGDKYSSNDLTIAKYKDVSLMQADAHIQVEHTDSDGDTTYVTIFLGRFMIFEFPKKFNFRLEVVGKHFGAYRVIGKNATTGRKASKITTESIDFNKHFRIYGDDGFEAYYILDPAFMEKIQNIGEVYKYSLMFGFIDNKLLVGLNNSKDSFEPPTARKPIDEQTESKKILDDIRVITDFVDKLSLDRKLFKD